MVDSTGKLLDNCSKLGVMGGEGGGIVPQGMLPSNEYEIGPVDLNSSWHPGEIMEGNIALVCAVELIIECAEWGSGIDPDKSAAFIDIAFN
jgi:hypothetical protein